MKLVLLVSNFNKKRNMYLLLDSTAAVSFTYSTFHFFHPLFHPLPSSTIVRMDILLDAFCNYSFYLPFFSLFASSVSIFYYHYNYCYLSLFKYMKIKIWKNCKMIFRNPYSIIILLALEFPIRPGFDSRQR